MHDLYENKLFLSDFFLKKYFIFLEISQLSKEIDC
jgi:hypothetical protein